jgi:hypothetical protein
MIALENYIQMRERALRGRRIQLAQDRPGTGSNEEGNKVSGSPLWQVISRRRREEIARRMGVYIGGY